MGGGVKKFLPLLLLAALMDTYFQYRRRRGVRPPPLAIPLPPPPPPPPPTATRRSSSGPSVDVFCCSCNNNRAVWAAAPCGHRLLCSKCKESTFIHMCLTCGRVVGSWKHMAWGPAPAAAEPPLDHDA